ncbi:TadE/TadG family type IV pilus assembly protein [Ornithinimicrobium cerasi]|uniref:TadE-like protein n=1 Tax=Ornithinimicrobium cerasi TaxID=2248773 RepID=A0A285VAS3_9MICO|nr:TadE/TadG family type IV pilus assembly protein [Ornithinimicrobium cerasi]SOC51215.1 TadE-like protein [Ornithinimicrobium cerasi]
MIRARRAGFDRGSVSVEMVILGPVLLFFVLATFFAGRYALAQQSVQAAAAEAARAASIARSAGEASGSATGAASASLANQDLRCVTRSVSVDTSAFAQSPGTPGLVTATVSCQVDMSDLAFPGIPGNRTLVSTMSSPLDTYRSRQG